MQKYNSLDDALDIFSHRNDLFRNMILNDSILDRLKDDFNINSNDGSLSNEDFNNIIDELILNAYMTQSYSEKGRAPVKPQDEYDVIVDVDGVLVDLHSAIKLYFLEKGIIYKPENIRTYDFNKNKPDSGEFDIGVSRSHLIKALSDITIFKNASVEWDAVFALEKMAYDGARIAIYTIAATEQIYTFRHKFLRSLFSRYNNIDIYVKLVQEFNDKSVLHKTKFVIEDSLSNLARYDDSVYKCLIDKPYNSEHYNPEYETLFHNAKFSRHKSTTDALAYIAERLSI